MRIFNFWPFAFGISMLFFGCDSGVETNDPALTLEVSTAIKVVEGVKGDEAFCSIAIPAGMKKMTELNAMAMIQYGHVYEEVLTEGNTVVFEHYAMVLMETKEEIQANHADFELNLTAYFLIVTKQFESLYGDKFEVLKPRAILEEINGVPAIQTEAILKAESGRKQFKIFYKIAVFEGSRAYYQVITWCVAGQRSRFESKMEQIIMSFKEIAPALN